MKNLKFSFFSLFVILTLGFSSCSSDDDDSSPVADTFINFSIDGTAYSFTNIATAESLSITLNGNNGATFTDPGDTQIALWLPLGASNGTFNVEGGFDADYRVSFSSDPLLFDFDFAESGTITITQSTGEYYEGTFTASITNDDGTTIELQNGSFRAFTIE